MAVNHTFDETAGHPAVVSCMAEASPLWRSALLGAYVELVSVMMRGAVAAVEGGAENDHVEGVVSRGDIVQIEPWETDRLVDGLLRYGYMETLQDGRYRLIRHEKLLHWKRPATVALEKAKRRDVSDPKLRAQVRHRDGDQCRVCHLVVRWNAKDDDPEAGTFDHKIPGTLADGNPDLLAITCRRCNGIRSNRADANAIAPWQPEPENPYYTENTARYLRERHGYKGVRKSGKQHLLPLIEISARPVAQADPARSSTARPDDQSDTAQRDPATSGTTRTSETPVSGPQSDEVPDGGARPGSQPDTAREAARPALADTAQRDPAPSGIPRAVRPESDSKPIANRSADSPPAPPDPRSKLPHQPAPPTVRGREGKGVEGSGVGGQRGRRQRGRRSKSKSQRTEGAS